MGVAWYISLEHELPGASASSIGGKAFAEAQEGLAVLAEAAGVAAPSSFLSQSEADAAAMAEEIGVEVDSLPKEHWFSSAVGLAAIRGILPRVRATPGMEAVVRDVEAIERVLDAAATAGVRFHFSVDF